MIVYRVEHKDTNLGPYVNNRHCLNCDVVSGIIREKHNSDEARWPMLSESLHMTIVLSNKTMVCGFKSHKAMNEWFDSDDFAVMDTGEFVIRLFNIHDIHIMTNAKQLIFNRERAYIQQEFPISSYKKVR